MRLAWKLALGGLALAGLAGGLWFSPWALAQGTNVNPPVGSIWTYLGATYGAAWAPLPSNLGNTPESAGAIGDGLANDTAGVTTCINNSVAGFPCYLKNGKTYLVGDLTIPSNARIEGEGTLKRLAGGTAGNFLTCTNCSNVCIKGITVDGNKAAQTNAANNLGFTNYKNICLIGVKTHSAKGGSGVVLDTSVDEAADTYSVLDGVFAHHNDIHGIYGFTAAWKLQLNNVTATYNGQYGAYFGPTGAANNIDSTLKYIQVSGGDYSYNSNTGLAAQGFITGYVDGVAVYGAGIEPVFGAKFTHVTATGNAYYGIVLQARESLLADSVAMNNATGAFGAGVMANGENVEVRNVISNHNTGTQGVGLEMGCGLGVHVTGGSFSANTYAGINAGCGSYSSIRGAEIINNTQYGIYALAADGAGDDYGIVGYTQSLVIADNRLACPSSSAYGVVISGGLGIEISRNYVQGCEPNQAILAAVASAEVRGNVVLSTSGGIYLNQSGTDYEVVAASGTLQIPVWADTVSVYGVNNFNSVQSREAAAVGTGVYSLLITAGGSGYPQHPTATWSGCTTPPTGTVMATRSGVLTGYRFITTGSGCVNPTVTFSGGTGGVALPYQYPLSASFQKELTILVGGPYPAPAGPPSTLTVGTGGNISISTAITTAGPKSTLRLFWAFNAGLYEMGRTLYP